MPKHHPHRWPLKSHFVFTNKRGKEYFSSTGHRLDLSDALMLSWPHASRVVYMSLSVGATDWEGWDEGNVRHIEDRIRHDLGFDTYGVSIQRITTARRNRACTSPFTWRLHVRPLVSKMELDLDDLADGS